MRLPPKKRDENIVTPVMLWTIFITAAFFVVVMLVLLVGMKGKPSAPGWFGTPEGPWSIEVGGTRLIADRDDLVRQADPQTGAEHYKVREAPADIALRNVANREAEVAFTLLQVSLFFSVYVFFQVWNQINCRSLTPDTSGLSRIWLNPTFLAIASTVAVGQIIIVSFGGPVFNVQPLGPLYWLGIIAGTASVLVFAEVARRIRLAAASRLRPGTGPR
jgi:Ca2+-transporting ATPase